MKEYKHVSNCLHAKKILFLKTNTFLSIVIAITNESSTSAFITQQNITLNILLKYIPAKNINTIQLLNITNIIQS
jgi:hypothetical protein